MGAERYRVKAPTRVFGVEPGQEFTRDIPEPQLSRLLKGGAIEKVGAKARGRKKPDDKHEAEVRRQAEIQAGVGEPEASSETPDTPRRRFGGPSKSKE